MRFHLCGLTLLACSLNVQAEIPFTPNATFGVNYSIKFSNLNPSDGSVYPYYAEDFEHLKNCSYLKEYKSVPIKIFDDLSLSAVMNHTDNEIFLGFSNENLKNFASDMNTVRAWINNNLQFLNRVDANNKRRIRAINVGNEIFATNNPEYYKNTAQAMRNMITALEEKGLSDIKVTTTTCCALESSTEGWENGSLKSLPGYKIPSSYTGGYEPPFIRVKPEFKEAFKNILKVIKKNNSFLSINLYPPFAIKGLVDSGVPDNVVQAVINGSLFKSKDGHTGHYLVEDMIQGYDYAIIKLSKEDPDSPTHVDYVVSEIGWPRHIKEPNDSNFYVNSVIAKDFYQGLKTWVNNYTRTLDSYIDPYSQYTQKVPFFIFSFRDEAKKNGDFEPYWGIYTDTYPSNDETGLCSGN